MTNGVTDGTKGGRQRGLLRVVIGLFIIVIMPLLMTIHTNDSQATYMGWIFPRRILITAFIVYLIFSSVIIKKIGNHILGFALVLAFCCIIFRIGFYIVAGN